MKRRIKKDELKKRILDFDNSMEITMKNIIKDIVFYKDKPYLDNTKEYTIKHFEGITIKKNIFNTKYYYDDIYDNNNFLICNIFELINYYHKKRYYIDQTFDFIIEKKSDFTDNIWVFKDNEIKKKNIVIKNRIDEVIFNRTEEKINEVFYLIYKNISLERYGETLKIELLE